MSLDGHYSRKWSGSLRSMREEVEAWGVSGQSEKWVGGFKEVGHSIVSGMFLRVVFRQGPLEMVFSPLGSGWGTSLVVHGEDSTWVRSLVGEDSTCGRATKLMCHNYWSPHPRASAAQWERPRQWETHAPQWRVALLAPPGESLHVEMKTQHSQRYN